MASASVGMSEPSNALGFAPTSALVRKRETRQGQGNHEDLPSSSTIVIVAVVIVMHPYSAGIWSLGDQIWNLVPDD